MELVYQVCRTEPTFQRAGPKKKKIMICQVIVDGRKCRTPYTCLVRNNWDNCILRKKFYVSIFIENKHGPYLVVTSGRKAHKCIFLSFSMWLLRKFSTAFTSRKLYHRGILSVTNRKSSKLVGFGMRCAKNICHRRQCRINILLCRWWNWYRMLGSRSR